MGQEIDLRYVVRTLLKRWKLIRDAFILAVVAGLVASVFLVSSPVPTYQATARMSIVRLATEVELQDKIRPRGFDQDPADIQASQRNTLAALVKSPRVAEVVIDDLGDRLPDRLRNPNSLVGSVDGRTTKDTDVVDIVVTGGDPSLVVEIANAWAKAFQRVSTDLYSLAGEAAATVAEEVADAWEEYQNAVDAAVTSTSVDKARELAGQAAALKAAISDLERARQGALSAAVDAKVKTARALESARTLRDQAAQPGASPASTAVALAILKAQVASIDQAPGAAAAFSDSQSSEAVGIATTRPAPSNVVIEIAMSAGDAVSPDEQLADITALIQTLETRLTQLDSVIEQRSGELTADIVQADSPSPLASVIKQLNNRLAQVEADLARERAVADDLERERDAAWETYEALSARARELSLESRLPRQEVTLTAPAATAQRIDSQRVSRPLPVAMAGVVGLLVGVFGALLIESFAPRTPTGAIPWTGPLRWLRRPDQRPRGDDHPRPGPSARG